MSDKKTIQAELKVLRAERKALMVQYGDRGQLHHTNVMLGGLNPAAMRLYNVRGAIARLEHSIAPPKATLTPKGSGRGWDKRAGLLYVVEFHGRKGEIGRDSTGKFYLVEHGELVGQDHKTLGLAVKAFETHAKTAQRDPSKRCTCGNAACKVRMARGLAPFCTMPTPPRHEDGLFGSYAAAVAASPIGVARWVSGGGTTGSPARFRAVK